MTIGNTSSGDWDAATYDRIAGPMARWGEAVVAGLDLGGGEHVVDAGCGTGRVTAALLARLPEGRVTGVDRSAGMLAVAQRRFGGDERVRLVQTDLLQPLPLDEQADMVFSTATFHWIDDHDLLFRNLAAALRPRGMLVAQCGGIGNIENVMRAAGAAGAAGTRRNYASCEDTERRLAAAGFTDIVVGLQPEPTQMEPGDALETYLAVICLRSAVADLDAGEATRLVARVARHLEAESDPPVIGYVRLNISARRALG